MLAGTFLKQRLDYGSLDVLYKRMNSYAKMSNGLKKVFYFLSNKELDNKLLKVQLKGLTTIKSGLTFIMLLNRVMCYLIQLRIVSLFD